MGRDEPRRRSPALAAVRRQALRAPRTRRRRTFSIMSTDRSAIDGLRIERQGESAPASRRGRWLAAAAALLALAVALGGWLSRPSAAPVRVAAVHEAGGAAGGGGLNDNRHLHG